MYNSLQLRFYANECPRLSRIMKLFAGKEIFKKHNFSSIWQQVLMRKRNFTINIWSCQRKQFARRSREVEIAHSADRKRTCTLKWLNKASKAPTVSRSSAVAEIRARSKTFGSKTNGEGQFTGRAHSFHRKKALRCALAVLKSETSWPSAPYSEQAAQRCAAHDVPWLFPSLDFLEELP
ncbi:hypothetical protein TRVL_09809 [Trypanosoma vivax]|nr:hypothetical protein TRVL_09809 [Trypanosoma vivax]